ncbi:haloalkane dehalogenase [Nocardia cyriacigeorgica]|uniref:Haloalkane dehalogenase n=1 Tax=Nocardia cyriacigeorgica TaxID=135487 RepID=A0A6P1D8R6_9NOCA|nr:haloalkane dehalogenase [Nocardia cyriacigeorgica]NEW40828.1 haloalkane dehalogenase [Nocardia cyriacigeorgica]NEW45931.1 haloalkane dehalogenase [Nocardia cyriacigeorgica]NEW55702.1 haloalkane dehalogenase [Nocardia cyriacigeorgica]
MLIDFVPDAGLYPFDSRWFDSSVGRVHYIDEGAGPTILFCHGAPAWSFLYRHIVKELRDRYRCVAVDNLGFGLSARPAGFGYTIAEHTAVLAELIDHLQLDDFIVMGQDWGGPIGLGAVVPRADRVRGIVLGNTVFWPIEAMANRAFSVIMSSGPMQRRILERNLLIERVLLSELGSKLSAAEADHYRMVQPTAEARCGLAATPEQIRAARPLLDQLARDVPAELADKPALLVWGMRDMVFRPNACIPRMRAAFTDVEVVELPRAGHFIQEHEPEVIAAAIAKRFP